jgi:hypothetical protein
VKVVWSPLARDQVVQAYASIAADRPASAACWLEQVLSKAVILAVLARFGPIWGA